MGPAIMDDSQTPTPAPDPGGSLEGLGPADEWVRLLVASVQDYAIFTIDTAARITSWNEGARRIKGYTAEEIIGRPLALFYRPEEKDKPQREMQVALATGRSEDESWRVRKDGSLLWVNEVMTPLRGPDGSLRGFTKISRDLTERKRAEELLRASEERLRLVVESVRDYAIVTLDTDGRVVSWNPGAELLFGYSAEEALGRFADFFFTEEDRARDVPAGELREAARKGRAEDERWHARKDGRRIYVSGVMAPLAPSGVLAGYVKVARDLTDRKNLDDTLRQAHEEAQQANRAKDEFLAMLGHELRNPLAPMVSALEVLRLTGGSSPAQAILERQVAHLTRMVDDLLDVSRVIGGKLELARRAVELREVVDRALELAGPLLEARRNRVEVGVAPQGLLVDADPDRIAQVLSNLLINASRYSDPGSRIGLAARPDGPSVRVAVTDEGMGIAPEMLDAVFEPFVQQPQSLERKLGGLGLGLAIVRSLVEAHGGRVSVASGGVGQGSTFEVELPAGDGPQAASGAQDAAAGVSPASAGRRVLVVDDNTDAAQMLQVGLERLGYQVEAAYDGPSAIERALVLRPDVVLLDIGLPGMDGYEVAKVLRLPDSGLPDARLIALTGYGQPADRQRTSEAGFDVHLVKPVNLARLQRLLEDQPA